MKIHIATTNKNGIITGEGETFAHASFDLLLKLKVGHPGDFLSYNFRDVLHRLENLYLSSSSCCFVVDYAYVVFFEK